MNTKNAFLKKMAASPRPVVVDFWAPWCVPCRRTKPVLEALGREYVGRVDFQAVNADEHPDLARELGIFAIPTLLVFRNGRETARLIGAKGAAEYRDLFEALAAGEDAPRPRLSPLDRLLRLGSGAALLLVGAMTGTWWLAFLGALLAFLGVYDRCPLWRAVTRYWKKRTGR
ncbi:MAG: thioredoxin [Anaerolineae bacterium]|nr:MAG: thioredoxin [Anaerolineae bacterium]